MGSHRPRPENSGPVATARMFTLDPVVSLAASQSCRNGTLSLAVRLADYGLAGTTAVCAYWQPNDAQTAWSVVSSRTAAIVSPTQVNCPISTDQRLQGEVRVTLQVYSHPSTNTERYK